MSLGTEHLNDRELISVIDGSDFADGQSESAAHFEHCQICQQRMEMLAAEPWLWDNCRQIVESTAKLVQQVGSESISGDLTMADQRRQGPQRNSPNFCELLESPNRPEMLGRLDQYDIETVIGQGGMGIVFKAIDTDLQRTVAIKMQLPHLANHDGARKRFLREARSAAAISHEHVVNVYPSPFRCAASLTGHGAGARRFAERDRRAFRGSTCTGNRSLRNADRIRTGGRS